MRNGSGGGIRAATVAALCALFFLFSMGVTLLGSGVYRSVAAAADENYRHRTAMSYLVNQIRRHDEEGGIALGSYGDSDALMLYEQDGAYVTLLYCSGGYLRELYIDAGGLEGFSADDGAPIIALEGLRASQSGGRRLELSIIESGGTEHNVLLFPRCGLEGGGAT